MPFRTVSVFAVVLVAMAAGCQWNAASPAPEDPYAMWSRGPWGDPSFFPIMVWAQDPALAPQYKALGVNTYLSLHGGPTDEQLARLAECGLYAICAQNEVGLEHLDDATIIAWMHGDEPDNFRPTYKGPVPFEKIADDFVRIIRNDPTRPVLVNFGQGVANEAFRGRALPYERYGLYAHGADIVSFDVYPVANIKYSTTDPDGRKVTAKRDDGENYLWYVAKGLDRLRDWTGGRKPVWNVLECTAISHPAGRKVTPHQMRAEVWMSLVHGATGLCWFVHDFRPGHRNVAALLVDEEMKQAVAANNRLVRQLAPVLNSPTIPDGAAVESSNGEVPIDVMVKHHDGAVYLFAVGMRRASTRGTFRVRGLGRKAVVEVIGENRTLAAAGGVFVDEFAPYDVHLYKIVAD